MSKNKDIEIFNFNIHVNPNKWYQISDTVMGGVSNSSMLVDENGHGVFSGNVSLENNGGFTMTRLPVKINITAHHKKIELHLIGDGKTYQFRIKSTSSQFYWYIQSFEAKKGEQKVELLLKDFYPSYRGNTLKLDNFSADSIKEIAFFIGNKKDESFNLVIDKILLK
ncbi:CIA30 family protein [Tamlana agarivorans]|uniref:CIA30 family protein n=1 Tax=Pseudotamlana agarivorans TaxID=481183 RepID=A0ACC5UBN0_9FLAO|nr:CIA30 family protein [Tamlana agarivorans]MBU2951748.1 CIA30 family protein [Tamlana agarivorans]